MILRARKRTSTGNAFPHYSAAALSLALACLALCSCGRDRNAASAPKTTAGSSAGAAGQTQPGPVNGGVIAYLEGKATLFRAEDERPLDVGDQVFDGDSVKTGARSKCEIVLPGVGSVFLQPDTILEISSLSLPSRRAQVTAKSGGVLAKIKKLANTDDFILRTDTAACGVRGTAFSVRVVKKGVRVAVAEGVVALYPDAMIESGLYSPGSPGSARTEDLPGFPLLEAGEASLCDAASFERAGSYLSGDAPDEGGDPGSALEAAAAELDASVAAGTSPITKGERKALEDFMALPETPDPPYLMSMSPAERPADAPPPAAEWPNYGLWHRKAADASALPRMDVKSFYLSAEQGGKAVAAQDGDNVLFDVSRPVPEAEWNVQALFPGKRKEKGAIYRISLVAWADAPHRVNAYSYEPNLDLDGDGNPYSPLAATQPFLLGTMPQRFTFVFRHSGPTREDFQASLTLGSRKGKVWLREFRIDKVSGPEAAEYGAAFGEMGSKPRLPFNGDFSRGLLGWRPFAFDEANYGGFSWADGVFRFSQREPDSEAWHSSINPVAGIGVRKGRRYRLDFDMRADPQAAGRGGVTINLDENGKDIDGDGSIWTAASPGMFAPSTAEWTHFSFVFPVSADLAGARLLFGLSAAGSWVELDDLSFTEVE